MTLGTQEGNTIHSHKRKPNMSNMELAMQPFYRVIQRNEFQFYNKSLAEKDSPEDDSTVFIYETREDIARLCRYQEKLLEKHTGKPRRIFDERCVAVFRWNRTFGMVSDQPLPETRWQRYFDMNPRAPCNICLDVNPKRTICGNCAFIVCFDCKERIHSDLCPCCRVKLDHLRV